MKFLWYSGQNSETYVSSLLPHFITCCVIQILVIYCLYLPFNQYLILQVTNLSDLSFSQLFIDGQSFYHLEIIFVHDLCVNLFVLAHAHVSDKGPLGPLVPVKARDHVL